MALTPDDIERRRFATSPNGYDRHDVDAFLVEAAASFRYAMQNLLPGVTPLGAERSSPTGSKPGEIAKEVAEILDAAHRAAASVLAEAENDAARVRASADHHAAQLREQAERDRDRVKRLLLRSEEQASSIIAQAEARAQQQRASVERDSVRRTRDSLARAKRRADDLTLAEHQLIERLTDIRGSIDALLRDEPLDDATDAGATPPRDTDVPPERSVSSIDVRPHPGRASAPDTDPPQTEPEDETPADRASRLVQAAVSRAATTASGGSTPTRRPDPRATPNTRAGSTF